jgi:hypothetical protein
VPRPLDDRRHKAAIAAIVAAEAALLTWVLGTGTVPDGTLAAGTALTGGLAGRLLNPESRWFWTGFSAGAALGLAIGACFWLAPGGFLEAAFYGYLSYAHWMLSPPVMDPSGGWFDGSGLAAQVASLRAMLFVEMTAAVPVLLLALVGGVVAAYRHRRGRDRGHEN